LGELATAGRLEALLAVEERQLAGALQRAAAGDPPESLREAELAGLRLLVGDLSLRGIATELFRPDCRGWASEGTRFSITGSSSRIS
jgi:hypothetical protein